MGINRFQPTFDNKYSEGAVVYAKECPNLALIVRRYVHRIYYCRVLDSPEGGELAYYERELA